MKVIFLDVDGVLNSTAIIENSKSELIDRQRVKLLKTLLDITGAVIVMHSGWRYWFDDHMLPQTEGAQFLYHILGEYGIRILSKTPDFSTEEIRQTRKFSLVKAREIKEWLSKHGEVESYVVLDDLDLHDDEIKKH